MKRTLKITAIIERVKTVFGLSGPPYRVAQAPAGICRWQNQQRLPGNGPCWAFTEGPVDYAVAPFSYKEWP